MGPTLRRHWGRLGMLLTIMVLALSLAGCMKVDRAFTINGDGSGVYVLTIGLRYPTPGDPSSLPAKNTAALDTFGAQVQQQGGSYRRYDEQGYAYWAYTRPFASVTQAEGILQEDPRQDDSTHFLVLYHDALNVTAQAGLLGPPTYHVTGTISLADLTGSAKANWADATESLTVTMAGGLLAHQGGAVGGDSVTYQVAYNQTARVDVTGRSTRPTSSAKSTLVLGIGILALVLGAVGIWLLARARRQPMSREVPPRR